MSLLEQMDDDLDLFFDTDGFAVSATIGGATVYGIFDEEYAESLGTAGTTPVLYCKTSDVTTLDYGESVAVNGVNYTAGTIEQDGTGVTRIELVEA